MIGFDGKMTELAGKYAGLDRFETRKRIVEDMKELGLIDRIEPYRHSVGVCYRCKTVVEPRLSTQWFVKMAPLAAKGRRPTETAAWPPRKRCRTATGRLTAATRARMTGRPTRLRALRDNSVIARRHRPMV